VEETIGYDDRRGLTGDNDGGLSVGGQNAVQREVRRRHRVKHHHARPHASTTEHHHHNHARAHHGLAGPHTGVDRPHNGLDRRPHARPRRSANSDRRHDNHQSEDTAAVNNQSSETTLSRDHPTTALDHPVDTQGAVLLYRPAITAYNYGRPPLLSQSGHNQYSQKFHAFRRLLLHHGLITRLQTVAADPATQALGVVRLDHQLAWDNVLDAVPGSPITLDHPVFMEALNTRLGSGQDHGWIVYRTTLPARPTAESSHMLNISGTIRDRVQVCQLVSSFLGGLVA